ncbi:MAG TPA: hypothetical protein VG328_11510 [Stellaceae bacterium]|jgi:filamentous hemagglutinin|nr:hypothetical protein [Stellaceae bacterium]
MLDVAGGVAIGTDSAPQNIRPATAKPNLEFPRPVPDEAYPAIGLGGVMDNKEIGIVWGKGSPEQGAEWENKYGELTPNARRLVPGSTGFDYSIDNLGEAVDTKTLNTLTVSRIERPQQILSTLKGYINKRGEDYTPNRETDLDPDDIESKTIQLAVPQYTSPTQWLYLNLATRYARDHGISLVITRIRE